MVLFLIAKYSRKREIGIINITFTVSEGEKGKNKLIGMSVEMVTRKIRTDMDERGIIVYGYKFRPVLASPQ